jgi:hypothetical protein
MSSSGNFVAETIEKVVYCGQGGADRSSQWGCSGREGRKQGYCEQTTHASAFLVTRSRSPWPTAMARSAAEMVKRGSPLLNSVDTRSRDRYVSKGRTCGRLLSRKDK